MPVMTNIVVIGAGVAGIQAALDIAGHGVHVDLVEREPSIGGHMAQLDKTFPTNDCSMCILSPKMVDVSRHPDITIHTCSEVERIEGETGNFRVTIKKHPRYINPVACTGCGDCIQICPVEVYNRFDAGVGVRKAIYKPHAQAVPDIVVKDPEHCIECGLCYDVCGPNAILKTDEEVLQTIDAAGIVLTTGYEVFDARKKTPFNYLRLPDVITSLELERMINAGGPTGGKVKRLSDGREPRSIVFIQCVGSRDMTIGCPSCSCVCCMQALKNAILIREKNKEIDVTICYMDIRAYGKGYEEYFERAKSLGVRFLRGCPPRCLPMHGRAECASRSRTRRPERSISSTRTSLSCRSASGPRRPAPPLQRNWALPARRTVSSGLQMMRLTRSRHSGRGSMLPGLQRLQGISRTALPRDRQRRCGHGSMRSGQVSK